MDDMKTDPGIARILFYNVGYCTGIDGAMRDYLLHWHRYIHTSRTTMSQILEGIEDLVSEESPDVCCLLEIHKTTGLVDSLRAFPHYDVANKYSWHGLLRHLPFFRRNCNGVFSRRSMPVQRHYFKAGRKKLVYEMTLPNETSLFVSHLSLTRRTRRRQLQELAVLLKGRKRVILCGDFNAFHEGEMEALQAQCNLAIANPPWEGTFPSHRPRRALDLFLCSPDIVIERIRVLHEVQLSDHLPIVLDVRV